MTPTVELGNDVLVENVVSLYVLFVASATTSISIVKTGNIALAMSRAAHGHWKKQQIKLEELWYMFF